MDSFSRWTVPAMSLNEIFDDIINSFDQKALKHDTDKHGNSLFFKEAFEKHDIDPQNSVFIDDSRDKENFIANLGMKYIQVRESSELPDLLRSYL